MRLYRCCIAVCAFALASPSSHAQGAIVSEYDLKAAYLYHFLQFTDWPAPMQRASESLQVCIDSSNPMLRALKAIEAKLVHGKPIVVKAGAANTRDRCQVAIVNRADIESMVSMSIGKNNLNRSHTLTISDDPAVSLNDTIIRMWTEDGRIVFSINNTQARERGLEISSKLLRLAGSVQ